MTINKFEFPEDKIANVQPQLEKLVEKNYFLNKSAKDAYRGYLLAYASHNLKEIFNVHQLDLAVRAAADSTPSARRCRVSHVACRVSRVA
jgi:ATP-dependent RNA helicase DDX18/HAS1